MNRFQTIIIIVFIIFIAIAVFLFSTFRGGSDTDKNVELTVWGVIEEGAFKDFFRQEKIENQEFPNVTYVRKDPRTYENDLIEAVAKGNAPDVAMVTPENLLELKDLLFKIPFSSYSERTYKDNFIEQAELFIDNEGLFAFPIIVDPMVMYWNRNLYQSSGLSEPPEFLDQLFIIAPRITNTDDAFNIEKSALALGEYDNILHAKEILSSFIIQSGTSIVKKNADGSLSSSLGESVGGESPTESSLRFFTEFANPTKTVYSWNKSLPEAKELFLSGDLATYFGFASEIKELRNRNPNLNFDVALMPQIRDFSNKAVYGQIYGFAVLKNTSNLAPSFRLLGNITSPVALAKLSAGTLLPPVRRDLLSLEAEDAVREIFNSSAIISQSFIDPESEATEEIFERMIESVVSGSLRISEAVNQADRELGLLIVEKR